MAKIIYSLAQNGRGHASRGYEVIRRLAEKNHQVLVLTGGDTYNPLEKALDKMKNVSIKKLPGLQFIYKENGKIDYWKTSTRNIPKIFFGNLTVNKLKKLIEEQGFDFAISDFEPYLPRAAKSKGINFMTIDNQHRIIFEKPDTHLVQPKHIPSYVVAAGVVFASHPLGNKCIVASVFKPHIKRKRIGKTGIIVVGPIIRKEVEELKEKVMKKDFVLVYAKPVLEKAILPVLAGIDEKFVMYVSNPAKMKRQKNIKYKEQSHTEFPKDLARCKAVISSAGEQLMSEALYLGKPIFLLPEGGTFEQVLNGYYVKQAGVGSFKEINKAKQEHILDFLRSLKNYNANIKKMRIKNSIGQIMKAINSELKRAAEQKRPLQMRG
ncbi:hypothetical protein JXB28_04800 [Candidatus Woesearchaeota archaeon]|nr:hypothetical protein [Candidatus Woesearchaeota archaeon]